MQRNGTLMINIQQFDHLGIRITDRDRALKFYEALGFKILIEVDFDAVIVIKNDNGVEINLVVNGVDLNDGKNILMDVPEKHPGLTHVALRVESIIEAMKTLNRVPSTLEGVVSKILVKDGEPVEFGQPLVSIK